MKWWALKEKTSHYWRIHDSQQEWETGKPTLAFMLLKIGIWRAWNIPWSQTFYISLHSRLKDFSEHQSERLLPWQMSTSYIFFTLPFFPSLADYFFESFALGWIVSCSFDWPIKHCPYALTNPAAMMQSNNHLDKNQKVRHGSTFFSKGTPSGVNEEEAFSLTTISRHLNCK